MDAIQAQFDFDTVINTMAAMGVSDKVLEPIKTIRNSLCELAKGSGYRPSFLTGRGHCVCGCHLQGWSDESSDDDSSFPGVRQGHTLEQSFS